MDEKEKKTQDDLGKLVHELRTSYEKIDQKNEARVNEFKEKQEKIEQKIAELEAKLQAPPQDGTETKEEDQAELEKKAFDKFLRKGDKALGAEERKVLTLSNNVEGGYLATKEIQNEVLRKVSEISELRPICRVKKISSSVTGVPKKSGNVSGGWVSEIGDRLETEGDFGYGMEDITPGELEALVKVSRRDLEDPVIDIEDEITTDIADKFDELEGTAFLTSERVNGKPEGILMNADIGTLASEAGTTGDIEADDIVKLPYEVKKKYRKNGRYLMNSKTVRNIRLMKEATTGAYIWVRGFGQTPNTINGYPYVESPDIPETGTGGAKVIVFGDFVRGYWIVDRLAIEIQRLVELYATSGQIGFLARKRVGGQVVMPEALHILTAKS